MTHFADRLIPELGLPNLQLGRGWDDTIDLAEALASRRGRDRERGHTTRGPHRADWTLTFDHAVRREHLSRGQEKLVALTCLLAQAQFHAQVRGHWPLLCLDDLASELDFPHQRLVLDTALGSAAQVLVSGTQIPEALRTLSIAPQLFHVEHGAIRA